MVVPSMEVNDSRPLQALPGSWRCLNRKRDKRPNSDSPTRKFHRRYYHSDCATESIMPACIMMRFDVPSIGSTFKRSTFNAKHKRSASPHTKQNPNYRLTAAARDLKALSFQLTSLANILRLPPP